MARSFSASLAHASVEMGRVLAARDEAGFHVEGTCMYPTLRQGDVLHIRPCTVADVAIGDLAVCRSQDHLFAHRVVATGAHDGRAFLVTRPDRARYGSDAPTFDEGLLGVVAGVERHGRPVSVDAAAHVPPARLYYRSRLALMAVRRRAGTWLVRAAERVQGLPGYGILACRWYAARRPRLRYTVRVPFSTALGDSVVRELDHSAFDPSRPWNGRTIDRWTLVVVVNDAPEPGAWTAWARDASGTWTRQAGGVRLRYRATGLDDALERVAADVVARDRASHTVEGERT